MKVIVNKDACIGCGACNAICPDVFEINDEGLSEVIEKNIKDDLKDDIEDAASSCPTSAIEVEE